MLPSTIDWTLTDVGLMETSSMPAARKTKPASRRRLTAQAQLQHWEQEFRADFARDGGARFEVMVDNVGNRAPAECLAVLRPGARFVAISGPKTNRWLGPVPHIMRTSLAFRRADPSFHQFTASPVEADLVTLGDATGVVSRIQIRATTVTNWDRQELIIPNKDLITGRLINWTLSDSTNRILVNVGVAYGTDTRVACTLLETICDDHPQVAKDPKPVVTFDGFGDSTLNLVLRCFLTTLDVRLQTIHELHTDINERFSKAGIEIAFPQRDLHLRSLPPELLAFIGQERKSA